jgi:hypothetical protein
MKFRTMEFMVINDIEKLYDFLVKNPKLPKVLLDIMMKTVIDFWKSKECEECEEDCEEHVVCSNLKLYHKNLINIKPNKAKKYLNIVKNAILEELNDAMDKQDDDTAYQAGNTLRIIREVSEGRDLKLCYLLRDYSKGLR